MPRQSSQSSEQSSKPAASPAAKTAHQKSPKAISVGNNYAFIDSQNLNLGTQRMGWKLDWRRFRQYLETEHHVTKAYMFIGYMAENEQLYEYMHELGYLIVLKPTVDVSANNAKHAEAEAVKAEAHKAELQKLEPQPPSPAETAEPISVTVTPEAEKSIVKGNIDADLVLYAMKELPNYDNAIIVSGDGDFFSLAEYLQEQNKLAAILTPNWQYSGLLKPFENSIIRLDQMRRQLTYYSRKKSSPKK